MCGILGIIDPANPSTLKGDLLNMLSIQNHRGPDAQGTWHHEGVGLGHNRLSIIDLSERGNQPMQTEDGHLQLVFNGEIYNFKSIRKELLDKGYSFRSETDSEVILKGYHAWGPDILKKLNGMFALAIYDRRDGHLFLARDRFGQKPLFYYWDGTTFYFASELNTFHALAHLNLSTDLEAVDLFLSLQYIPAPYTIYQEIKQLGASEYLILKDGQLQTRRYYDINIRPELASLNFEEAKELLREKLDLAVKRRLMADVPLGSFLSGGIDSSIITSLIARNSSKAVTTVSVGFESKAFSELPKAASIAQKYGTDHHEFVLSLADAEKQVVEVLQSYGQPFADPAAVPTYFLSQITRQQVTVALSGDGGDELFTGYQRYHLDLLVNRLTGIVPASVLRLMLSTLTWVPPKKDVPIGKNWPLGLRRMQQVLSIDKRASILRWGSYFSQQHKKRLMPALFAPEDRAAQYLIELFEARPEIKDFSMKTQYSDLYGYAPGDYLVKTDIASMQHSLEVRCPFLDYEVAELAFSLNPAFYRNQRKGKHLLKEAFKEDLTDEVLYGPKQGFTLPVAEWFRGSWLEILQDFLCSSNSFCKEHFDSTYVQQMISDHQKNKDDHSKRLYTLLALEAWNVKQ
jgi:asparagine synthase (glutamine-hydrolysing)